MKIIVFFIITTFFSERLPGQTFSEFFSQRKTQKKYLLQQIAALQVYAGYLEKGYSIARQGLGIIDQMTKGEFNLHDAFFISLKVVRDVVRDNGRVGEVKLLNEQVILLSGRALKQANASGRFSAGEISYLSNVFKMLSEDCNKNIEMLIALTTDDALQLKEDERLRQIEQLYEDMQDKYVFACSFSNDLVILRKQRSSK